MKNVTSTSLIIGKVQISFDFPHDCALEEKLQQPDSQELFRKVLKQLFSDTAKPLQKQWVNIRTKEQALPVIKLAVDCR